MGLDIEPENVAHWAHGVVVVFTPDILHRDVAVELKRKVVGVHLHVSIVARYVVNITVTEELA